MKFAPIASLVFAAGLVTVPALAKAPHQTIWVPTWYASPEPSGAPEATLRDQTLRQIVRVSAGGTSVRLRLSNAYGALPLRLDDVHVARRISGSRIEAETDRAVTFNGRVGTTVAPGAYALSDPITLDVAAGSDLAVSVYAAGSVPLTTVHDIQRGVLYVAAGRQTGATVLPETPVDIGLGKAFPWIAEVAVSGGPVKQTIIAFGDSITDGYGITPDRGATWPDVLSHRLREAGIPLSVVNAGLSGNRLLHHGTWARFGDGALARFDRDVLAQPNATAVIILIGINDLGHAQGPGSPEYVSADDMIDGLSQMAARAHERGLRVYAGTLTPFEGTVFKGYYSEEKEGRRQAVNAWIRKAKTFDGVFDFDKALQAPGAPKQMRPDYDVGDHLHPDDEGAAAMANVIPLGAFDWVKR